MTEPDVTPHSHNTPDVGSALTRKLGPLPGWAWVAIAVAVYAGYAYYRKRNPSSPGTGTQDTTSSIDPTGTSSVDGGLGAGSVDTGVSGAPTGVTPVGPTSNGEWGKAAVQWLENSGANPTTANNAVAKYLSKQVLTPNENVLIGKVLVALGPPPNGVIPVRLAPTQKTTTYVTRSGDTLHKLALHFYGHAEFWGHIKNRNPNLSKYGPDAKLPAGLKIIIPFFTLVGSGVKA